jgi:hypothetical protein
MYDSVTNWHRKHGGINQIAASLSRYDRPCGIPMTKWSDENLAHWASAGRDLDAVLDSIPSKSSVGLLKWYRPTAASSGLPLLRPKIEVHEETLDAAYDLADLIMSTPERRFDSYPVPPVIPFVKSLPSPREKYSTRGVWGYPAVITYIESVFGTPLYDLIMRNKDLCNLPFFFGSGTFSKARAFVHSTPRDDDSFVASLDFVKGDTQPLADKLRDIFKHLESKIDFSIEGGHRGTPHREKKLRRLWAFVQWYFINTPIVFNEVLYRKTSGFPSGSLFTMLMWLLFNFKEKAYLTHKLLRTRATVENVGVGGDDGLLRGRGNLSLDEILTASSEIGTEYHPLGKSMLHRGNKILETVILSTQFKKHSDFARNETDLFARMVYPPGWVSTTEESVGRVLTIAMSVCKSMPRVVRFADLYLDNAPVNLKRPIKLESNYIKYFRLMMSIDFRSMGATLEELVHTYLNDVLWTFLKYRL